MPKPFHALSAADVCRQLDATPDGLTAAEAARRLAQVGPNRLRPEVPPRPWRLLLRQFANVLVVILLVGAALSAALGEGVDAAAITVIVLLAVGLGFVQEYRAERALAALQKLAAPSARVQRDGRARELTAEEVVPGDVLLLAAGQRVPADGRLLEAVNLKLDEAALTGESVPVEKVVDLLPEATPLAERTNLVFAGTVVRYGRGRALVTATGMQTEFGRIAALLQAVEEGPTPLQRALDRIGRMLARAALVLVGLIVLCGLWRGQELLEMLLFGIALAVAVVPEALPAVVTIALALGVQRMARRHALVRRLPAVETLGCTTVICTDKTGTLTRNQMMVRRLWAAGRLWRMEGEGYAPQGRLQAEGDDVDPTSVRRLLRAAALASDATLHYDDGWQLQGDPTEGALVAAAARAGLTADMLSARWPRREEIPFTAENRWMATRHQGEGGALVCLKGAPEAVLDRCDRWLTASGEKPLTADDRQHILAQAHALAAEALRVLAAADGTAEGLAEPPQGLVFLGLAGMLDPPRAETQEAVATCRRAGIRVLMLTGDHPRTAAAIAAELGIGAGEEALTGVELDDLDESGLDAVLARQCVYARVSPEHKLRLVRALQRQGEVTAMTGDGVNDAPALKQADIGIAMGITGTDVSREAADMTLTDDNFASIVAAVEEGRIVFGNIRKFLIYLLSANLGEIGLMAGAVLLGMPLPLTAVQILYINLATDGLPALALAVDPPAPDLMAHRPRPRGEGVFTRPLVTLLLAGGTTLALLMLALFVGLQHSGWPVAESQTLVFVTLALCEFHKTWLLRTLTAPAWPNPFANRWLNRALLWEVSLLLLLVYAPPLQRVFGTFPLTATDWLLALAVAAALGPVVEGTKWLLRRRRDGQGDAAAL